MKKLIYIAFSLLFFYFTPTILRAQVSTVWVLGDGEKVYRDDLSHPSKKGNQVWDGERIRIQGLYNEVLAIQVIAEVGPLGTKGLEVGVELPVHTASGKSIGGSTQRYGEAGTIELFTQHYLHVVDSTAPNWFYGSEAAKPRRMKGWIPDALIPADALPGKGGFPVEVLPEASVRNQGFWIDIHLPRDRENFPPGAYSGNVIVYENGTEINRIPLAITLLPHYLPDENLTTIWVYSSSMDAYFPELPTSEVDKMIKFEGHRHRIDMIGGFAAHTSSFDVTRMSSYLPYLNGSAYTPAHGYRGPGEGFGERLFPIGMYGLRDIMGDTPSEVQQQADLWVNWFESNAPQVNYFWYMIDEPTAPSFDWIKERADWLKSYTGPGKTLPTFTTTTYKKELEDAIDIWAGYNGLDLKELLGIRSRGGDHWFYNGNRPRYGSVILEAAAVDLRVNSWILYKYNIPVHFIWHSTAWQHNSQGPKGRLHQNIYRNPLTFINNELEFGNGDGILFYPGKMPFYPEENRGINGAFPSIRLKNIRRGQQDALIMDMAEKKAGREKVITIISKVVPRALSEVRMDEPVPWSESGDDYDRARLELLKLL